MVTFLNKRMIRTLRAIGLISLGGCLVGPGAAKEHTRELPKTILEAFQKEGYSPVTVILIDKAQGEVIFETAEFRLTGVTKDIRGLKLPHLTIQNLEGSCYKVICGSWGCGATEVPC